MNIPTTRQFAVLRKFEDEGRVPYADIWGYMASRLKGWLQHDEMKTYWTLTPYARRKCAEWWFTEKGE